MSSEGSSKHDWLEEEVVKFIFGFWFLVFRLLARKKGLPPQAKARKKPGVRCARRSTDNRTKSTGASG